MNQLEKINKLFFALTLLLSLVSFSGNYNQPNLKIPKTELVVKDKTPRKRFSVQFHHVNKITFTSFFSITKFSFNTFQSVKDLKVCTFFKAYTNKTRSVITEQIQNKLYAYNNQNILYEDIIV